MKITLVCVGKLKEEYLRAACQEYLKRLLPYAKINVHELPESTPEAEGARIAKLIDADPRAYKIAMAIEGAMLTSTAFADKLGNLTTYGVSHVMFVIGGAEGLSDSVKNICDMRLSMSKMTFTHQMARVLLLEQIYRAFRILGGEPYHK